MAQKLRYTEFYFIPPKELGEREYHEIKSIFNIKPNYNLCPKSDGLFIVFRKEVLIITVSIILSFIVHHISKSYTKEWVEFVLLFLVVSGVVTLISLIISANSYEGYLKQKGTYFIKLEQDILESKDYNHFLILRKK